MITPPTAQEIYDDIVARLRDEAGISVDSPSSIASALAVAFSSSIYDLWKQLSDIDRASNLDLAVGEELDRLGILLGVSRKQARKATTEGYGPSVVFKNNSSVSVVVPANTLVFASRNPSVNYSTLSSINVLPNGTNFVDVEAKGFGPSYNVAQFALNSHNLGLSDVKVYNPRAISSGSDLESDDSYRERLYNSVNDKRPSSRLSIRQSMASLPGVRDAIIIDNAKGPGSFDVLLVGDTSSIPFESITEAENYLALNAPLGVSYRVITPSPVPVDVNIKLVLDAENEIERQSITEAVKQAVSDFFYLIPVENGSGNAAFFYSSLLTSISYTLYKVKDYTIDISIDDIPIAFGANYSISEQEQFVIRKIAVK
jgi:uncharacterized phage protein gp47/JayE